MGPAFFRKARGLGVSGKTVTGYCDLLVDMLLVRRLQPWHGNVGKRLVKSPEVYVRDSGVVHALLELKGKEDVVGLPVVGGSWEGFVVYPGDERYPLTRAVEAINPADLAGSLADLSR